MAYGHIENGYITAWTTEDVNDIFLNEYFDNPEVLDGVDMRLYTIENNKAIYKPCEEVLKSIKISKLKETEIDDIKLALVEISQMQEILETKLEELSRLIKEIQ